MILLTGSTGNIGAHLARHLIQHGKKIRLLVRDLSKQDQILQQLGAGSAEIAAGDLADPLSLTACFDGIHSAFLLTPVSQKTAEWKRNFIHASRRGGIQRIVNLSVAGAGPKSPVNLFRWHWEAEQDLESSGVSWTHLRPTDLTRYNIRAILPTVQAQGAFYSTIGEGRVAMVDELDVAEAAAATLTQDTHQGKTYTLTGPAAISYSQVAEALSQKLGKPISYIEVTPAQAKRSMTQAGIPEWVADFINDLRELERNGGASGVTQDVAHLLGRPARSFDASLAALLA